MAQWDNTQEWKESQLGIDYNNKLGIYTNTELNWNMYNGKQWQGIKTNGLSKWTFNICKSSIDYFISFICSQKTKMQYSAENIPDDSQDPQEQKVKEFTTLLSNMAGMKWEKDKMDSKLRQLMLDGANSGDFCAYVYWDPKKKTGQLEQGDFSTEVVDGINVMFGNPNNKEVEPQPYILILGRDSVSKLKKEAKANKISKDLIDSITSDNDTQYQAGANGKIELNGKDDNGKCNWIIKFWKENDTVMWNKSTKYCPIYKDVDLGISRYPVAWGNWQTIKNSYHGMAVIDGIIDNQISINQLFAMVSYWMRMSAFGKVIYDGNIITEWTNDIGKAIKAIAPPKDVVYQLQAGNFNAAILEVINLAIKYTKDFIGANDSLMGDVNPEQASGAAIIAVSKQKSIPLSSIAANRDQFVEDLGLIWWEFFLKKYKNRKVSYRDKEKLVTGDYSTQGMEDILPQCKVDVGPSTYYSELTAIQTLDNLLKMKEINKLQYFERIAKMNLIPDCQGLIKDAQMEIQAQQQMMQQQAQGQMMMQQQAQQQQIAQQNQVQQQQQAKQAQEQQTADQENQAKLQRYQQMADFMRSLPEITQQRIKRLPSDEQEKILLQMMKDSVKGG